MKVFVDAYLFQNLGDDLFVHILCERYPHVDFSCVSHFHQATTNNLKVINNKLLIKLLGYEKMKMKYVKQSDLVVYIGGSMFIEGESKPSQILQSDLKTYILGSNFGPYQNDQYVQTHRDIFKKMQDVCFRDDYSYQLFKDIDTVRKASDIVFNLQVKPQVNSDKKAVISIIQAKAQYYDDYHQKMIELIKKLKQDGYKVCLMSFCRLQNDELEIEKLMQEVDVDETYYYRGNIQEALATLNSASLIVGSRFHANILGLLMNKTILPICYSDKTKNVLKDIEFKGKVIDLKEIKQFDVNSLNEKDYNYHIDITSVIQDANKMFEKLDRVLK